MNGGARGDDFVARGKNGHPRTAEDRHPIATDCGQHARFAGREQGSAILNGLPGANVRSSERDRPARHDGFVDPYRIALGLGLFHHDHGVRSPGDHAAGGDGRCGSRAHLNFGHDAGVHYLAIESELQRLGLFRAEGILRPHRESVYIAAVESRHIYR